MSEKKKRESLAVAEDYRRLLPLLCYSKFVPLFGEKIKFNNQQ